MEMLLKNHLEVLCLAERTDNMTLNFYLVEANIQSMNQYESDTWFNKEALILGSLDIGGNPFVTKCKML